MISNNSANHRQGVAIIYKEKKLQTHLEYEMLNNENIQIVSIITKFN